MRESEFLAHFRGVTKNGDGSWMAFCPSHPDGSKRGNRSLSLKHEGGRYLTHCFNGCTPEAIMSGAGLAMTDLFDSGANVFSRPQALQRSVNVVAMRKPLSAKQIAEWWAPGTPIRGTLAEGYLRARGIEIDYEFPSLRFLPQAPYFEGKAKKPKAHYPCLVAAIADLAGNIVGAHRTYLAADGSGKAPEEPAKKMLGVAVPWGARLTPPAGGILRIAEGIETILSVMAAKGWDTAQYVAGLSAVGLRSFEGPPFDVLEIYADNDPTGRETAAALALRAKITGARVFTIMPREGRDFNDELRASGRAAVEEVRGAERAEITPEERKAATRPTLTVTHYGLEGLAAQAWKAFERYNDPPRIFRGYQGLVRVNSQPAAMDVYDMRHALARAAQWRKDTQSGGSVETVVPLDLCHDMMAEPNPPVSELQHVSSHWLIDAEGRFLLEPGFDERSGIYLSLSMDRPFMPAEMTVKDAVALFDELLCDFKWSRPSDRANAFALMLLPFVRQYIRGVTPIHIVEAPNAGTGKGLLAAVLLSVAGLGDCVLSANDNLTEFHNRIESLILNYREAVIIDNLVDDLDSKTINSILTAKAVEIRHFYTQISQKIHQRMIWAATVNNPLILGDLDRRSVRIRILSTTEHPFLRTDIRDDELDDTMVQRRWETSSAAYAMVKAWAEGGYKEKRIVFGSFAHWAKVMGGILDEIGVEGFEQRKKEEFTNSRQDAMLKFLTDWYFETKDLKEEQRWQTSGELLPLAISADIYLGKVDKHAARVKFLTGTLNRIRDQIVDEFVVRARFRKSSEFKVEMVSENSGERDELPF